MLAPSERQSYRIQKDLITLLELKAEESHDLIRSWTDEDSGLSIDGWWSRRGAAPEIIALATMAQVREGGHSNHGGGRENPVEPAVWIRFHVI
jgi:hypothetical protein